MISRVVSLVVMVGVLGCGDSKPEPETKQIPLTHTWSVPDGGAFFVENDMGTEPAAHADPLMAVVPGLLHRLGTKCAEAAKEDDTKGPVTMLIRFEVDPKGGQPPKPLEVGPYGALSVCLGTALEAEQQAFEGLDLPKTKVLLRAKTR